MSLIFMLFVQSAFAKEVTFTNDFKPIVQKRCTPCHTGLIQTLPNFTLYDTAFKKRLRIRERVFIEKSMPPGGGTITNEERLIIKNWVDQGGKK